LQLRNFVPNLQTIETISEFLITPPSKKTYWCVTRQLKIFISLFTVNNKHLFDTNNKIHKYKTRNNNNSYLPITNLSKFNKGAYISGIKFFNNFPQYIKTLINDQKCFKSTLKRFLYHHSFYSMNKYYEYEDRTV
jgi:hypothetical protein